MGVREPTPDTPFFRCAAGYGRIVVEKHDGTRAEIGEHVVRTPERCHHWTGDGDIVARRTGFDEVVFSKTDIPVDVVVRNDEIVVREPGRTEARHEW